MALFEIMDDIAKRQVEKTETGDNRIYGLLLGVVTKNYDEEMPGRVCVKILTRDEEANELLWARVVMPSSGSTWGHYFLPEVGDEVLLAFEQGNIERPYVIGCIPRDNDKFLKSSADEKNQFKRITTTHGNTLVFEDNKDGADKDKIHLYTSSQKFRLEMDNEAGTIRISDGDEDNYVLINAGEGKGDITVQCTKKVTIKAGDTTKIIMDGDNGKIAISGTKIELKATDGMTLEANSKMSVTGGNTTVKGNSMITLESSGPAQVKGTPVKVG
ncbi:MAG: hypothetical protein IK016_03760 [Lachnospiraceae bacterium]|nr:hypothetical protein [Lachnospiraceae bacterium]